MKLSAIHIFAYGEAQIISDEVNYKAAVTKFTKLQAIIDEVKSLRPTNVESKDYHAINIFPNGVSYMTSERKGAGGFKVEYSSLNQDKLKELTDEFTKLKEEDKDSDKPSK